MRALDQLAGWDVPHAAAAVIGPSGVLDAAGSVNDAVAIASVTKPMAAYATLIAVEEGAVELDEPAGPPGSTIRHLLAHTAGYGFESGSAALSRPGARRIYSNQGFEVLQVHLEERTGIPFAEYLAEAVFHPLGMSSAVLFGSAAHEARASVEDLARFASELMAPTLVSPAMWRDFVTVQFPGLSGVLPAHGRFDPLDWGLGVERNFGRPGHWSGPSVSRQAFGHFGGWGTFFWVDPAHALAAVGVSGRRFGPWADEVWPPLMDAVIQEFADVTAATSPDASQAG